MEYLAYTDGWRGRIGLIATAPGNSTEKEFNKYRPDGVAVLTTRIPLTSSTVEGIRKMNEYINASAEMLTASGHVDMLLLSSTAGSFVNGIEWEKEMVKELSDKYKVPVLTSCACILQAFEALNIKSVTIFTPSSASLYNAEKAYFEACGISFAAEYSMNLAAPSDILRISPLDIFKIIRQTDVPDSDAIFLSCSGLHVAHMIEVMEKDFGKPVIASNQCSLWGALKLLKVNHKNPALGKLFTI
jgi:maleate isomerase